MDDAIADIAFAGMFYGLPVLYAALQFLCLLWWRGGLQWAAAIPLAAWLVWGMIVWRDTSRDPSSHSLLPFEALLGTLAGTTYLVLLLIVRAVLHRGGGEPAR
jgi:hypothetical protein